VGGVAGVGGCLGTTGRGAAINLVGKL
jgi:hypothetical protein